MSGHTSSHPRLSFHQHGNEGPKVLMVMGLGMRGLVWRPQIEGLASDHQLVTFDNRGIGDSDTTDEWWTMDDLGRDALQVANALGWDRFHLVGISLGGMIAQHAALTAPERLLSLSLLVTQPGGRTGWMPPRAGIRRALATVRKGTLEERSAAHDRLLFTERFAERVPPERIAQRHADAVATPPPQATLRRQLLAVARHDVRKRLHELTMPTLVLQAGKDVLIRPAHSDTLARSIPAARLVRIHEAGHGVIVEHRDVVNQLLREHIQGAETS